VVCEVGRASGVLWRDAFGHLSYAPDATPATPDTVFDLASLTKVIVTTTLYERAVSDGRVALDSPLGVLLPEWMEGRRPTEHCTVRDLLAHAAGLPAHRRLWEEATTRDEALRLACATPLERPVGMSSVYSDIGFILLGMALERLGQSPLDVLWRAAWPYPALPLDFRPDRWEASDRPRYDIAPTEDDPWRGRVLCGDVHDENAALLDGVAGHAGVFGSVGAVGQFARDVLRTFDAPTWLGAREVHDVFTRRVSVPGSSRALGWDTMLPTSSCGTRLSPTSIGHTGFTGTSVWIDPERDLYIVVLSNRVHPTRANERFPPMRAHIHDAVIADFG
jgi:CubicO group peptidase (beta-lactamase class C family)